MNEFESGDDLAAIAARGPLPVQHVITVLRDTAAALDEAAARGRIHGDVRPGTIRLDPGGHAHLTDVDDARPAATAATLDTVAHASPEQLQAWPVDPRSDQYSLACTAVTLLTGVPPYPATIPTAVALAHAQHPVPAITARRPDLPPAVDAVFYRALAKNPAERYPTSSAFVSDLTAALGGPTTPAAHPISSAPAAPAPALPKRRFGRISLIIAALVVVVALAAGSAYWLTRPETAPDAESRSHFDATAAVTVAPEAAELRRQSVTPNLPSLESRPSRPRWEWNPAGEFSTVEIIGGTDRYVLGAADRADSVFATFAVLDAQTGRTVHTVSVPVVGRPGRPVDCVDFRGKQLLFCLVSDSIGDDSTRSAYSVIDLEKGTYSDPVAVAGYAPVMFATADRAVLATDAGTVAFDTAGREVWSDSRLQPGHVGIPQGSPVVDNGGGRDGETLTLHSAVDGRVVHQSTPPGHPFAPWAPFLGGFMVVEDGGVGLFDEAGRRTSTLEGWWPVGYDERFNTVTALPIVFNDTSIAAVDPATGTVLWERPNGVFKHAGGVGSLVVIPPDDDDPEKFPGYWLDVYTGVGGEFTSGRLFAGTDGTRLASAEGDAGGSTLAVHAPDGRRLWELREPEGSKYMYSLIGGHIYFGNRQIL
ncbi:PQQ-binding-like beta-propeller repeat protein [Gordonia phthalatica]|uniref:serine/threonine-protein kinase n=1 Tax=Gordonia phthalatica TaxID=1136941 RepID=UPI00078029EC|nr:serine/threonine-protein kinase [Gordonia phthalatica]